MHTEGTKLVENLFRSSFRSIIISLPVWNLQESALGLIMFDALVLEVGCKVKRKIFKLAVTHQPVRNCKHFGQESYNSKWSWQTGNKSEKGDCNSVRTCTRCRCRATSLHTSWEMFSWQVGWKGSETPGLTCCMWVNSINAIGKKHTWLPWRRLIKLLFHLFQL